MFIGVEYYNINQFNFEIYNLNYFEFLEPRKALPNLKTDEPVCPKDQLQCGNGECINKDLFCNDRPDCKDESDENACSKYYRL